MTNARRNANTDTLQQHRTKIAVIATHNAATACRLVYHEPEVITYMYKTTSNVGGGQRHPALVERRASTNYYLKMSPRLFPRIEHTQHTTHHKTRITQHNTDKQHLNNQPSYSTTSRWKAPTIFLLSRRALRPESWGSDIVRRAFAPALSF